MTGLADILAGHEDVDMRHEYLVQHVQPLAVRHYLGLVDHDHARLPVERRRHDAGADRARDEVHTLNDIVEFIDAMFLLYELASQIVT